MKPKSHEISQKSYFFRRNKPISGSTRGIFFVHISNESRRHGKHHSKKIRKFLLEINRYGGVGIVPKNGSTKMALAFVVRRPKRRNFVYRLKRSPSFHFWHCAHFLFGQLCAGDRTQNDQKTEKFEKKFAPFSHPAIEAECNMMSWKEHYVNIMST